MTDCATQCTAVQDGLMIQVRGLEKIFGEGESRDRHWPHFMVNPTHVKLHINQ